MRAAVVSVLGEGPKYQEFPDPEPVEGESLIEVRAAGLLVALADICSSGVHKAFEIKEEVTK